MLDAISIGAGRPGSRPVGPGVTMRDGAEAEADSLAKGAQGTVFGAKLNPAVPCPAAGNADFRSAPAHDVSKDTNAFNVLNGKPSTGPLSAVAA
jgi:hypothetical protein